MKNLLILCISLFFLGNIASAQYHNTTIDYTPDTDCSTLISEAGGSYAFDLDVNHSTGGWGSITQQVAWLSNVDMTYKLVFTNVDTGNEEYTHVVSTTLANSGVSLDISHNTLYTSPLGDGKYSVELFVQAIRNGNSSIPVDFRIDDLASGLFSENTLQSNNSSIEFNTGIIFCFEYERCDDIAVQVDLTTSGYDATITYLDPDPSSVPTLTYVWTITSQDGSQSYIYDVESIPTPIECSSVEVTVTHEETGCRYFSSHGCLFSACSLPAPTNFGQISMSDGTTLFYWPPVPNADGYRIEIIYNDPDCCPGEGPTLLPQIINTTTNSFSLSSSRKYRCFSYRVVAKCGLGGVGNVSDKQCYTLPLPSPFKSNIDSPDGESSIIGSLSLYPNPASDQVQISLTGLEGTTSNVTILDSKGAILMEKEVTIESISNEITWDITGFEPGIYIVRSKNNFGVLTEKFTVIK